MLVGRAGCAVATDRVSVDPAARVLELCKSHGFALAGVCDASPTEHADELRAWLAAGKHGEMAYLAEHVDAKLDPGLVLEGAVSAVMVADLYHTRNEPEDRLDPSAGRVARYARGRDYHVVIKKRLHAICDELIELFPEHRFRAFTDTAPVAERELAARAGIGWTGKHTLAINPELGSWFVLGGILTTLELTPPSEQRVVPDHCGTCTRCIDACPTDAITPYSVDASRCISYLTIEHRSPIDTHFFGAMGDWIAGCDICQEVCPHNSPRPKSDVGSRHAAYEPVRLGIDLMEVARWSAEDRTEAVRGSALKRIKLEMFRRNALIAIGNAFRETGDQAMLDVIEAASADESELVRQTARDLLADLDRPPASPAG